MLALANGRTFNSTGFYTPFLIYINEAFYYYKKGIKTKLRQGTIKIVGNPHLNLKKSYTINTHFDHRGAEARRESAALIARHVKRVSHLDPLPVVVMGDLNCLPNSEPYKNFQRGEFKDALLQSKTKHQGPMSSWNGFGKAVVPGRRIDFIFVGPHLKVLSHKIDASQFKGRFPSDHCPVIARLSQP